MSMYYDSDTATKILKGRGSVALAPSCVGPLLRACALRCPVALAHSCVVALLRACVVLLPCPAAVGRSCVYRPRGLPPFRRHRRGRRCPRMARATAAPAACARPWRSRPLFGLSVVLNKCLLLPRRVPPFGVARCAWWSLPLTDHHA